MDRQGWQSNEIVTVEEGAGHSVSVEAHGLMRLPSVDWSAGRPGWKRAAYCAGRWQSAHCSSAPRLTSQLDSGRRAGMCAWRGRRD